MPDKPTFLVVGDFSEEHTNLAELCAKFGWVATGVTEVDANGLSDSRNVVAGIVDASFDGGYALSSVSRKLPDALWIACCRFGSVSIGSGAWCDL